MKRDYVERLFGGKVHRFQISRADLPTFECAFGEPAYGMLTRFLKERWHFEDVSNVLTFALDGPTRLDRMQARAVSLGAPTPIGKSERPVNAVVRSTLLAEGHGNFADLAADILTAAIFGESDEN